MCIRDRHITASGQNTDSSSQTIYWRMVKNGENVNTGSFSCDANYYWAVHANFFDVEENDTIELRLWASSTNVNWDYDAHWITVTRLKPLDVEGFYHMKIEIQNVPSLSSAPNPSYWVGWLYIYIFNTTYDEEKLGIYNFPATIPYLSLEYRYMILYEGDKFYQNTADVRTHSSYHPYRVVQNRCPSTITFRVVK